MDRYIIQYGKKLYYHVIEDNYAVITGYGDTDVCITFNKDTDGYFVHRINVPETINGFHVLAVGPLKLKLQMYGDCGYRHNGSSFIELLLPEHTAFCGFDMVQTDVGYFYPEYRIKYYPRKHCNLLHRLKDGFSFYAKSKDDGACSIIQIIAEDGSCDDLRLPEVICGCRVTSIAAGSTYKAMDGLRCIRLSDDIERIGASCFKDIPRLEKLYLGRKTALIANGCFYYYGESSDESMAKPLTVYYYKRPRCDSSAFVRKGKIVDMGERCFDYEVRFVSLNEQKFTVEGALLVKYSGTCSVVRVPDGVRYIASEAFSENEFIKTVFLPDSVEEIGAYAFRGCLSLKKVRLSPGITKIQEGAFEGCISLESLTFPQCVTTVEKYLCKGCIGIKCIELPHFLNAICECAFEDSGISEIDVPYGVVFIKYHSFARCKKLKRVTLPVTAKSVDAFAFSGSDPVIQIK